MAATKKAAAGPKAAPRFETVKLAVAGRIATITLNRPQRLNAINAQMPRDIRAAVEAANADDRVHVIVARRRRQGVFAPATTSRSTPRAAPPTRIPSRCRGTR